ncbi:GNVR domain-containing protein [Tunturiibacter empetritectus]|uniref:LPS O-antigen subunit length determinant protein (WzzB/FepE family) n=2 Tax=Tunturiibacter TaxID=3154218 RepID=A0A852VJ89_9BACT|nr:GNVR domain-containing protein [Edaphobacter lichenicola]NYF91229.1 LPS O-antigen subunit length determinant protein (WzzB/FepE family) [Edaphobacter lichenicola]
MPIETPTQSESSNISESTSLVFTENEPLSLTLVLQILQRSRRFILKTAAITFILATILAFILPPYYTATGSFVPPGANNTSSAAALMGQLSAIGAGSLLGGKGQGDLYVGILKSHTVARDIVQRFNLMQVYKVKKESLAEKKLLSESEFTLGTKDPIVTVSVTDKSPERARDLAAGYLQTLQATSAGLALSESSQRRLFYEQRLAKEKDDLANAEVALKLEEEKSGLVAPVGQMASNIQAQAQVQAQITDLQTRLAALLMNETEQNPDILRLRTQIESLQSQASQLAKGNGKNPTGSLSSALVPGLELDYIRKAREVKYHQALFEIIAKQYEAARLDEAKDSPLQVLDQPVLPDMKSGPHRSLIMALGLVIGVLGSSAWVLLRADTIKRVVR